MYQTRSFYNTFFDDRKHSTVFHGIITIALNTLEIFAPFFLFRVFERTVSTVQYSTTLDLTQSILLATLG